MLTALLAPPGLHHSDNRRVQDNLPTSNLMDLLFRLLNIQLFKCCLNCLNVNREMNCLKKADYDFYQTFPPPRV